MIKRIAHLGDIHIFNDISKHNDLKEALGKTIESLKNQNIDRIIIAGDLFHNFIKVNNEAKALAGWFLRECSEISDIIITVGNHDLSIKTKEKLDSIKVVVDLLNSARIKYLNDTGFYEDENVVYCVWHHPDKLSPWVKYPDYKKEEDKVYIDIFHDPIYGSKNAFGKEFKESHYVNINDFKGDLLLAGDIHKRQWFNKNDKLFGAYSSSLYQNNFGEEALSGHGYLVWDITDKENITVEEFDIETDFVYFNFYINPDEFDYENINIPLPSKPKIYLKIHWRDYSSNISAANERKLKQYIKQNYPEVIFLTFDKDRINNTFIEETDYIKKSINNIDQQIVQQEVFREFLKEKHYDDDFINEILALDEKISNRLNLTNDGDTYDWEILSFYLENYRSHGDRTEIDWEGKDGLWQVTGLNGTGKTNLLSVICYLFYGITLETKTKDKFGDNRFINNKRNLDFCEAGGIIRINGVKYSIVRRTERKWDKTKTKITGTPTTITYNILDEDNKPITNLTEQEKTQTNKIIGNSLATFEDFLRKNLVNADTLNNLLSVDESVFIDTILRDSGLDIFEKKGQEYKLYNKEIYKKEERVVIKVDEVEDSIENDILTIGTLNNDTKDTNVQIKEAQERIDKGTDLKENEIKKLHKIDEALSKLKLDELFAEINRLTQERINKEQDIQNLENEIGKMKSDFDQEKYNDLLKEKDSIKEQIFQLRQEIQKNKTNKENNIQQNNILNGEIHNINKNIKNIESSIESEKGILKQNITLCEDKIKMVIKNIDNQINNIKDEIQILENSKICPSCNRELGSKEVIVIQDKIKQKQDQITVLEESKISPDNIEINKFKEQITTYEGEILNGNDKIKGFLVKIQENNTLIEDKNKLILELHTLLPTFDEMVAKIERDISSKQLELTENGEQISLIDLEKQEVDKRNQLILQKNNIPLMIENIDLKIDKNKKIYESYEENQLKVQENIKIQSVIDKYTDRLIILNNDKQKFLDHLNTIKINISNIEREIDEKKKKIVKFKEQERDDLIKKVYTECIHRDGLPKIILLRMRDDINQEIKDLLTDVNFTVYFDEDMILKMYHNNKPDAIIHVIGGCGMERTFISVILRLALRSINNKSVGNVLFLDEICGKLVDQSVPKFFELIYKLKRNIQKIVIIEHAYSDELMPDYIISVSADEDGVSKIDIK